MAATPASSRDLTFEGTMANFTKVIVLAVLMEVCLLAVAIYKAQTLPTTGDPLLRQISVGVPGFWAVVIPLVMGGLFLFFKGQTVTFSSKAFIFRRGRFSILLPWSDTLMADSDGMAFDRQFTLTAKGSQVVIRQMFFPEDYDDIRREVERRLSRRDTAGGEIRL